jgi:hypothetical protein
MTYSADIVVEVRDHAVESIARVQASEKGVL